ncbi:hypothetical protein ABT214_10960 [Micromonospora purpureochromogenes]|uniref:hypothetical protein n=1 Tax=Micromonospora purpureochromogenes TaxID=47872 RepID=UPI00331B465C
MSKREVFVELGIVAVVGLGVGLAFWQVDREFAAAESRLGSASLPEAEISEGRPCIATVVSSTDTRNRFNYRTVFEFELEVQPQGGSGPYTARVRDTLNEIQGALVADTRNSFRCVIDRSDSTRIAVFWSEPVPNPLSSTAKP